MGCQVLYHSVALFLCLMMIVHIRAQCTRPFFEGNVILSEKFLQTNNFQDGDQVTFECVTGYKPTDLKASITVNCAGNKWTHLQLECERKSCGSPPDFPNGKYEIPNGILFGDTITGVCKEGYVNERFGSAERTCRTKGWDGGPPQCEAIKCISPPHIQNGYIDGWPDEDKEYEYGSGVTYRCDPKFALVGSATLICSENESFQPEPPKCVNASCPSPTVINGVRTGGKAPPYSAGHFLEYKCNDGYDMKGSDHIVCTVHGWDPEQPQCIGYCVLPVFEGHVTIANSSKPNKFPIGSRLEFKCESGCRPVDLKASHFVTCEENTKWTPLELKCEDMSCGRPAVGGNVTISKPYDSMSKFSNGSSVTLECKSGYEPVDSRASKFITCVNTRWAPVNLKCQGYCGQPAIGQNVITSKQIDSIDKFADGCRLEFECKTGFKPVDLTVFKVVTCEGTKWTRLELTCEENVPESSGSLMTILLSIGGVLAFLIAVAVGIFVKKKVSKRDSFHKVTRNEEREL